jgi:hypothetical protein
MPKRNGNDELRAAAGWISVDRQKLAFLPAKATDNLSFRRKPDNNLDILRPGKQWRKSVLRPGFF